MKENGMATMQTYKEKSSVQNKANSNGNHLRRRTFLITVSHYKTTSSDHEFQKRVEKVDTETMRLQTKYQPAPIQN